MKTIDQKHYDFMKLKVLVLSPWSVLVQIENVRIFLYYLMQNPSFLSDAYYAVNFTHTDDLNIPLHHLLC